MKSKEQLRKQDEKVYRAVEDIANRMNTDYVQSWWLNPANCPPMGLTTKEINRACKRLVKAGKLKLDRENTSTSTGTCYRIVMYKKKDELYDADPSCVHKTYSAPGGGVKCRKCTGWFCF